MVVLSALAVLATSAGEDSIARQDQCGVAGIVDRPESALGLALGLLLFEFSQAFLELVRFHTRAGAGMVSQFQKRVVALSRADGVLLTIEADDLLAGRNKAAFAVERHLPPLYPSVADVASFLIHG